MEYAVYCIPGIQGRHNRFKVQFHSKFIFAKKDPCEELHNIFAKKKYRNIYITVTLSRR